MNAEYHFTGTARRLGTIVIAAGLFAGGLLACQSASEPVNARRTLESVTAEEMGAAQITIFSLPDTGVRHRKITLDDAKKDPDAAQRAGLWTIESKSPAPRIRLSDAARDPDAAKRGGLWDIAVAAK